MIGIDESNGNRFETGLSKKRNERLQREARDNEISSKLIIEHLQAQISEV